MPKATAKTHTSTKFAPYGDRPPHRRLRNVPFDEDDFHDPYFMPVEYVEDTEAEEIFQASIEAYYERESTQHDLDPDEDYEYLPWTHDPYASDHLPWGIYYYDNDLDEDFDNLEELLLLEQVVMTPEYFDHELEHEWEDFCFEEQVEGYMIECEKLERKRK